MWNLFFIVCSLLPCQSNTFVTPILTQTNVKSFCFSTTRFPAPLFAVKKGKGKVAKKGQRSTQGFGGAAVEACPCGSTQPYNKCCGLLHKDPAIYAKSTADQVVRARYSAYSRRVIDFIIASTHPEHESFMSDIEHWKQTMEQDCYDNFELTKCEILETSENSESSATVRFLAHMTQRDTQERTAFIETSSFERDSVTGAWLYKHGVVDTV